MTRYSKKTIDGVKFELKYFTKLNDQLAYNACLFINDEFVAKVSSDHNGMVFPNGANDYQKTIAEYDQMFIDKKKRWSYKGESHQYSVRFIVSLIAQRIMSHCQYSTSKILTDAMMQLEIERARLRESEQKRRKLEGSLISLQNKIRSHQVYNHTKSRYFD